MRCPHVFSTGRIVAQISNLLYRRFPLGWLFGEGRRQVSGARRRIEFCDTADWESALRGRRMLALNSYHCSRCTGDSGMSLARASVSPVAQIPNLPYRRILFCGAPLKLDASLRRTASRVEIGDTADWKSAIQQIGNLRYDAASAKHMWTAHAATEPQVFSFVSKARPDRWSKRCKSGSHSPLCKLCNTS